jgi:hypothetical protein
MPQIIEIKKPTKIFDLNINLLIWQLGV